jgi:hypothetical protein
MGALGCAAAERQATLLEAEREVSAVMSGERGGWGVGG